MNTPTIIYETGATSHAVNDLILFTDNTKELDELRDKIYTMYAYVNDKPYPEEMNRLYYAAKTAYYNEFGIQNSNHIKNMLGNEMLEYCTLYANDFQNWKQEHEIS